MLRKTNQSILVNNANKESGMIHDGASIVIDCHENTPLRQQATTSESRRSTLASRVTSPLRRRGANNSSDSTPQSRFHSWRWSGIGVKTLLLVLLVSWSTLVLSFRFVSTTPFSAPSILSKANNERNPFPPGTSKHQASQLRGKEKTKLFVSKTDGTLSQHALENKNVPMKLSLWLIPSGGEKETEESKDESDTSDGTGEKDNNPHSIYARTQKVIDDLSAERGGPRFIPHVTLGGAEVASEKEALALAEKLRTGLAGFGSVDCSIGERVLSAQNAWNQALVFELVPPFEQFLGLCTASRTILGMEPTNRDGDDCLTFPLPLLVPHMSLYYGNSPPPPSETYLSEVFGGTSSDKKIFQAHRIMLWKTDPSSLEGVSEWEPIADISIL